MARARSFLVFLGLELVLAWAGRVAAVENPAWEALRGSPILDIEIVAREVFDPGRPGEGNAFTSLANAIHMRTRDSVIRRELLFHEGEPFDPLRADESARNLRNLGIFQDAVIEVEPGAGGVHIRILTADRWTTRLISGLRKEGDIYSLKLGLENSNFLGRATFLGGNLTASNDIDALQFGIRDPRVLGSRWDMGYAYAQDELALLNEAAIRRPFYSEFVHYTADLFYRSVRGGRRIFTQGVARDTLDADETSGEAFLAGHAHGSGQIRSRLGVLFSRRSLGSEVSGQQAVLGLVWGFLHRDYRALQDIDRFAVNEDIGSGWAFQLGAGGDLRSLGGDTNRPFWRADLACARFVGPGTLLGLSVRHHGLLHEDRVENGRLAAETYGFWQGPPHQTLTWSLGGGMFIREPPYYQFDLGGDNRLRGYGARYDNGTRAVWFNLEDRLFSNMRLFFLRFGAAAFVDMAQAWYPGESFALQDTNVGAGVGLRIGHNKAGSGVARIDFAFGRDSFEVEFSSGNFFRVARGLEYPLPTLLR